MIKKRFGNKRNNFRTFFEKKVKIFFWKVGCAVVGEKWKKRRFPLLLSIIENRSSPTPNLQRHWVTGIACQVTFSLIGKKNISSTLVWEPMLWCRYRYIITLTRTVNSQQGSYSTPILKCNTLSVKWCTHLRNHFSG